MSSVACTTAGGIAVWSFGHRTELVPGRDGIDQDPVNFSLARRRNRLATRRHAFLAASEDSGALALPGERYAPARSSRQAVLLLAMSKRRGQLAQNTDE